MISSLKSFRHAAATLAIALVLVCAAPTSGALAQTAPPTAPAAAALSQSTISALQEALSKQGITVKVDGVLNDDTRAAIKKYQTQHHLPVTGEPDKATLDKLGVVAPQSAGPSAAQTLAQATPAGQMQMGQMPMGRMQMGQMQMGQMHPGSKMHCQMMQGQMQGMMMMMQGMMQMMQAMHGQMPSAQSPGPETGSMQPKQH